MGTYYVRKSGNDTTGDGSTGAPWLTLHKAISTISNNVAHTVKVGPGTYAEDSGSGYLSIAANRTEVVTIEPESGEEGDVIITGASHASYNVVFASGTPTKFTFSKLTFRSRVNTNEYVVVINANANISNVVFSYCTFEQLIGGDNDSKTGFYSVTNDAKTADAITFDHCRYIQTGTKGASEKVTALSFTRSAAGATVSNITFTNCFVGSQGFGCMFDGVTDLVCTDNVIIAEANIPLTVGRDSGTTAQTATGSVLRNKLRSASSHGMLLGNGCDGVIARGNRVVGGDHGAVIKNSIGVVFQGNRVTGGSNCWDGIYVKASADSIITGNVAECTRSGGWALRVGEDATHSTLYAGATVRGNVLIARNGADIYYWGDAAEETGETSVCNDNLLILMGAGTYGYVKGTEDCATLAAVQAAWAGYTVSTNDDISADTSLDMLGIGGGMTLSL